MNVHDLIKSENELTDIAHGLKKRVKEGGKQTIARVNIIYDNLATFSTGRVQKQNSYIVNFNREVMPDKKGMNIIYNSCRFKDISSSNLDELIIASELVSEDRPVFFSKMIPLPAEELVSYQRIPSNFKYYDDELHNICKEEDDVVIHRDLIIEQKIVVNSLGGVFIQSVPSFRIGYVRGLLPAWTSRDLTVVTNEDKDIKNYDRLIKYLADPTPDRYIKSSKNFTDAFKELSKVSRLKAGYLNDVGVPKKTLYDVIMLTGVPIHEIFGHHFEEPVTLLTQGYSNTFSKGQLLNNTKILLKDNPNQLIGGFLPFGHTVFDSYGRERKEVVNISDGEIKDFLGSEYVDQEKLMNFMGIECSEYVGNANQSINGGFPQARMSCTVLDGPSESIDMEGKIVCVAHSGQTDSYTKTYEVQAMESYFIKNGQPIRLLPLKISGGINQALENLQLISDYSYQTGFCGKSNPVNRNEEERVHVSQFAKSQYWKNQQVYSQPISEQQLKILFRPN